MGMNRFRHIAYKKLLGLAPIYSIARSCVGRELVHMDFEEARAGLRQICPYRPPSLPEGRGNWPSCPEVDLTVIVPCYGAEQYLPSCLESILGQKTGYSMEIVAIDDGSPDRCGEIIDRYSDVDERVRPIHQGNRGFSGARNRGIDSARGECLMFVDSDDELEDGAVQVLMDAYHDGDCDMVTANYSVMDENGGHIRGPRGRRSHGAPWGRIYSRELWRDVAFPEGLWFEDTVQAYCINRRCTEEYIEFPAVRYRKRGSSITCVSRMSKKGADTYWVVEAMLSWCRCLGIDLGQDLFNQTIKQFGPLAKSRVAALNDDELRTFFACCCGLLGSIAEFSTLTTTMDGAWRDIEASLRTRDYGLWKLACDAV